jgi:hypothetical protein
LMRLVMCRPPANSTVPNLVSYVSTHERHYTYVPTFLGGEMRPQAYVLLYCEMQLPGRRHNSTQCSMHDCDRLCNPLNHQVPDCTHGTTQKMIKDISTLARNDCKFTDYPWFCPKPHHNR